MAWGARNELAKRLDSPIDGSGPSNWIWRIHSQYQFPTGDKAKEPILVESRHVFRVEESKSSGTNLILIKSKVTPQTSASKPPYSVTLRLDAGRRAGNTVCGCGYEQTWTIPSVTLSVQGKYFKDTQFNEMFNYSHDPPKQHTHFNAPGVLGAISPSPLLQSLSHIMRCPPPTRAVAELPSTVVHTDPEPSQDECDGCPKGNEPQMQNDQKIVIDKSLSDNLGSDAQESEILPPEMHKNINHVDNSTMLDENLFQQDISQWRELSFNFVDYWARRGSASIQNKDLEILNSRSYVQIDGSKERKCTISMFDKEIGNGNRKNTVTRAWPCFSPVTGKLYCFHCALFSDVLTQFTDDGFCDWKNASCRFEKHEQSKHHLDSLRHKSVYIRDAAVSFLVIRGKLRIKDCRGQSYDNAPAMSGHLHGVQSLIRDLNKLAFWVPCAGHSLNLVGTSTMRSCPDSQKFFDFIEETYVFFIPSDRHEKLSKKLEMSVSESNQRCLVPKRVDAIRWGSRGDAVKPVNNGYTQYKEVLSELSESNDEAKGLLKVLCKLETSIYLVLWDDLLQRINSVSKKVQGYNADLNTSVSLLISLRSLIASFREKFPEYEKLGMNKSGCLTYQRKAELSDSDHFRINCYIPVIDHLTAALDRRIAAYQEAVGYFGFIRQLHILSDAEIKVHVFNTVKMYSDDLDDDLYPELLHFKRYIIDIPEFQSEKGQELCVERRMYKLIIKHSSEDVYPNTCSMLEIYLTLMTTNVTCERAFSKLKLRKNRLSASMTQTRLNDLSIMNIEYDLLKDISYSEIIEDFAERKSRKGLTSSRV
ncbi:hypothetical protein QAD02_018358 [Eretmocerus hayati]|uniref:Uncharacterized protein n=1 Tax=Eretmocerus hayati TaxID=131215 RepID=A0ACC2PGH8_9HYME|nr:hypothetical protein QAD02_018358 [Eretmocerus hayati]